MFKPTVNALCINGLFSAATIPQMRASPVHASFQRLLDSAVEATAHLAGHRRVVTEADLRRELDVTPQVANNWKRRGVSQDGALAAQRLWGMSATWIADGKAHQRHPGWTSTQHLSGGLVVHPEAQDLSQPQPDHEPPKIGSTD